MPANEFEKQVQKKLEEFQLEPSASVWEKVEEEVKKKKRRRVIFFIILPAALALLGYFIYDYTNHYQHYQKTELAQQQTSTNNNKNTSTATTAKETFAPVQDSKQNSEQSKTEATPSSAGSITLQQQKRSVAQQNNSLILINKPTISHKKKQDEGNKKYKELPTVSKDDNAFEITSTTPDPTRATQSTSAEENKTTITTENVLANKNPTNDLTTEEKNSTYVKKDSSSKENIASTNNNPVVKKNSDKQKIKWGIDFSGGIAANQAAPFSLTNSNNDAFVLSSVTAIPPGNPYSSAIPPSSIRPGPAFKVGVIGELKLSKRSRVSAGLQYAYASNKIKTGVQLDSVFLPGTISYGVSVMRVYRGTQQNDFTNRYHFISIPLGYHLQVNNSQKLALQWDINAAFNYLIATNALVYSSSYGGVYFHDKQAINKTHVEIGTGLSLRVAGKKGIEWIFGPQLSFDTRRLLNDGYGSKQYLLYGGIHTSILFSKKKK